ncbi:MAG TPA: ATP-binding protein, partial [Spirochaetota bacterium]|nr:ATP-binding protein [Spirochaetota bacterium]
ANKKLAIERERADLATKREDIFMAKMSHELRTPLNGIMGITDLIIDSQECAHKSSYLDMIREAAETLKYLIDDLLDLSKIENDLIVLNNNTFVLKNFLSGIVAEFFVSAQKKDIRLESNISDELDCRVSTDGHRLRQIYSNLLTNAIKYTNNGGVIHFDASPLKSPGGDYLLCVRVSDNGVGIPECDHKKIFSSFYRSIESYNNQSSGIGLGLYIVDRLVDLFKGTITVESREGEGSTFTVTIPVAKACEQVDNAADIETVHPKCKPLDILVAEDNRINAVFITSFLEKEGHSITLVDNGNDAVAKACANFYDLVLMDIQMPLLSGTDAVAKIREYEAKNMRAPLVIAAITAYASENEQIEIRKSGFDYYLSKPLDSAKLRSILRNIPQKNGNAD